MVSKRKQNAIVHCAVKMWENAAGNRANVVLYVALAIGAVLVGLASPLLIGRLMNAVQSQNGTELLKTSATLLFSYALLGVIVWALHGPSRVMESVNAFIVKREFQTTLFKKVTLLPMSWHRAHHSGQTIDQVARATAALSEFAESGFEVIHLLVRFLGATLVLFWLMPAAGLAIVLIGIIATGIIVLFDRRLIPQYSAQNKRFNEVAAAVQDYLTNVATIISLRLEDRVSTEIHERTERIRPLIRQSSITNELKWFTTSFIVDIMQAIVIMVYIAMIIRSGKAIEVGTMYALVQYLRSIGESFFQFTGKYGDLVQKSTRLHGIDHIEDAFDREIKGTVSATLPKDWKRIEIRDLCFVHSLGESTDNETVPQGGVTGVDLILERGKSYAFIGESGSGKSTVLGLIRGIHSADNATVLCDGMILPHAISHVAHRSTLIPQDPEIFSDTIRFNVTMGVEAADSDLLEAIQLARFGRVLDRLPHGLKTDIAEKGVSLSGGEKQRLALARGLFFTRESDSEIILLDEPTSSVDIINERLIYQAILNHFHDRVVISAVHRLELLKLFDEILVFANGRVIERRIVNELGENVAEFAQCQLGGVRASVD